MRPRDSCLTPSNASKSSSSQPNGEQSPDSKIVPSYPEYLGQWDPSLHHEPYTPLTEVFHAALLANPDKPNLLHPGSEIKRLTPKFGSVVEGVQLSSLTQEGKNELALLVAERGMVVFRDQDFANIGPEALVDYAKYYGPLHVFPSAEYPPGFPELHPFYRGSQGVVSDSFVHGHSGVGYIIKTETERYYEQLDISNAV
jgi:Taurine catabolism dioxygenase TauD, TfdA family